eukprot:365420-Chlamydomonas_euryale.AAC.1
MAPPRMLPLLAPIMLPLLAPRGSGAMRLRRIGGNRNTIVQIPARGSGSAGYINPLTLIVAISVSLETCMCVCVWYYNSGRLSLR